MPEDSIGNRQQQVASELKRVREAAGLSQGQMAARLGMTYTPGGRQVSTGRAAVSSWESGRRIPSAERLRAYIDLGGDPAILRPPSMDVRIIEPEVEDESISVASSDTAVTSDRLSPRGLRLWLVLSLLIVLTAVGFIYFFANHRNHALPTTARSPAIEGPPVTWTETTGTPAHTWGDPTQLTGPGVPLGPRQSAQVLCRVRGYIVQDGDPWWYRLASAPWNGRYYATSDAFYNNGAVDGPVDDGVVVDEQVPVCQ